MATATQYETLYGISLLDDLHNYFPAILYDPTRFRTIQQVLHYIQTNTRNRFDLFSFGQRAYLNTTLEPNRAISPPSVRVPAAPAQPPPPIHVNQPAVSNLPDDLLAQDDESPVTLRRRRREASPESRYTATIDILQEDISLDNQAMSIMNLLNVLGGFPTLGRAAAARGQALPNSFLEPVIVRPTQEQIDTGSTRAFPPEETVCAICQDAIPVNQMARRLNACAHTFHISCIDQWFQRDVRCPTCRHDVREPVSANTTSTTESNNNETAN